MLDSNMPIGEKNTSASVIGIMFDKRKLGYGLNFVLNY